MCLEMKVFNDKIGWWCLWEMVVYKKKFVFTICPEMLVSLIVCEVMEVNECIFLIGCETIFHVQRLCKSIQNLQEIMMIIPLGNRLCGPLGFSRYVKL